MAEVIELHDSDVAAVDMIEGDVRIEFYEAYIWAEDKGWGQKASLILENAQVTEAPVKFPVTISEGVLSGDTEQFDNIVPFLFSERGPFSVEFVFTGGGRLLVTGQNPRVELIGERRFIEEAGEL